MPPTTSLDTDVARQFEGLEGLQLQVSKAIISNCRTGDAGKRLRSDLQTLLESLNHGHLSKELSTADSCTDPNSSTIFEKLRRHASSTDSLANGVCQTAACYEVSDVGNGGLRADLLHVPASNDIWSAEIDQIWLEFIIAGHSARRQRTVPFVDSFPAVVWMAPIANNVKQSSGFDGTLGYSKLSFPKVSDKQPENVVSDRCLLVRAGGSRDIQLQLDHKRLAFLMALIDTIAQVKEEMDKDLASASALPPLCEIIVSAVTSDIRIDLLLSPVDEYSLRPPIPDDDDEIEVPGSIPETSSSPYLVDVDSVSSQKQNFDQTVSSGVVEDFETSAESLQQPPTVHLSEPDQCNLSVSSQDLTSVNLAGSSLCSTSSGPNGQSSSSVDVFKATASDSDRVMIGAPGMNFGNSPGNSSRYSSRPASQSVSSQRGLSRHNNAFGMVQQSVDLKKSFTQAIGKIGDKMKVRRQDTGRLWGDSDIDGWDTLSQRSDFTSDDDDDSFICQLEGQDELPAFEHLDMLVPDDSSVTASDTREDASDICSEIKSPNQKLISVLSVYLCGIEAMVKINGNDIAVDSVIDSLAVKENGNMTVEKFQEFFASGNKVKSAEVLAWSRRPSPLARLHVDIGHLAERLVKGSLSVEDARYLALSVCNVDLTLRITTLTHLNEMFNDDKEPNIFPMRIDAADIRITLLDDQMSKYIDVPKMVPIKFCIKTASVQRDEHGVFHISSAGVNPQISTALSSSVVVPSVDSSVIGTGNFDSLLDQTLYATGLDRRKSDASLLAPDVAARLADLEHENDILRRQLEKIGKLDGLAIERSSRPPSRDRRGSSTSRSGSTGGGRKETERLKYENLELIDRLRDAEDEAQALKQERESLLLTIKLLQDDLISSERQRQRVTPT